MTKPPTIDRSSYDIAVETLLEQLNMGRSFEELFETVYERLQGIVPYNRIGVALRGEVSLFMQR